MTKKNSSYLVDVHDNHDVVEGREIVAHVVLVHLTRPRLVETGDIDDDHLQVRKVRVHGDDGVAERLDLEVV